MGLVIIGFTGLHSAHYEQLTDMLRLPLQKDTTYGTLCMVEIDNSRLFVPKGQNSELQTRQILFYPCVSNRSVYIVVVGASAVTARKANLSTEQAPSTNQTKTATKRGWRTTRFNASTHTVWEQFVCLVRPISRKQWRRYSESVQKHERGNHTKSVPRKLL